MQKEVEKYSTAPKATEEAPYNSGIRDFNPNNYSRCDISKSNIKDFKHSRMEYVSGKKGVFSDFDFSYSIMSDCYFHNAKFINCNFTGAKLYRCNFRGATFENCTFNYIDANETRIDTTEILKNMPDYPNIGREIAQIMRRNSASLGDVESSRRFLLYDLKQRKEHIRRAIRGEGDYYKRKYNTFGKKLNLYYKSFLLNMDSIIWGHGEKVWKLFTSASLLLIFTSAAACFFWWNSNPNASVSEIWNIFTQIIIYYGSFFLSVEVESPIPRSLGIEWILAAARILMVGMLVSALFRWLSHR